MSKVESLARQLDGATPPVNVIDEYHNSVREDVIQTLVVHVVTSVFEESGTLTDKLIDRINNDNSVPADLKHDVYIQSEMVLRDMMARVMGDDGNVGSKEIPE